MFRSATAVLRPAAVPRCSRPHLHRWHPIGSLAGSLDAVKPGLASDDFAHHAKGLARLNHGSFGAVPRPVLQQQQAHLEAWLASPDEWFFSGHLQDELRLAARSAAPAIGASDAVDDQICLVDNSSVAAVTVARRWSEAVQEGDLVLVLSVAYLACVHALREYCERRGAMVKTIHVPFPCKSHLEILSTFESQLAALQASGQKIRFAFLDHVSSQPALLLPVKEMVALCRRYGTADVEVCVDGAHGVGSCIVDVGDIGADWYFSNLHKWGFAPNTATILHAATPELMRETRHPITSWYWRGGLAAEARFPGTRDYSALLATPAAMEYLRRWRSESGEDSRSFSHRRVLESASKLAEAWGTAGEESAEELVATQSMVRLPRDLRVDDIPGQPGRGVREQLRQQFQVEAAIGNFGDRGNFVRLSFAVYNTEEEIERLRNAVLEVLALQRKGAL